ncbi:MAG: AAA family ATPase [Candidatus Kariarchaeaceae archaeon]|jgi:AAA15 family ATPase/GTPase
MAIINRLTIQAFKSIQEVEIDCRKLNVFIGEPNSGKSNILEALGVVSWVAHQKGQINDYARSNQLYELFRDHIVD